MSASGVYPCEMKRKLLGTGLGLLLVSLAALVMGHKDESEGPILRLEPETKQFTIARRTTPDWMFRASAPLTTNKSTVVPAEK